MAEDPPAGSELSLVTSGGTARTSRGPVTLTIDRPLLEAARKLIDDGHYAAGVLIAQTAKEVYTEQTFFWLFHAQGAHHLWEDVARCPAAVKPVDKASDSASSTDQAPRRRERSTRGALAHERDDRWQTSQRGSSVSGPLARTRDRHRYGFYGGKRDANVRYSPCLPR
jgi:hypothetical protein